MNITEQSLVGAIVLAIAGTVIWIGGKAFDQVEANTAYFEEMASPELSVVANLEQVAREEAERRQRLADEHRAQAN